MLTEVFVKLENVSPLNTEGPSQPYQKISIALRFLEILLL